MDRSNDPRYNFYSSPTLTCRGSVSASTKMLSIFL